MVVGWEMKKKEGRFSSAEAATKFFACRSFPGRDVKYVMTLYNGESYRSKD